MTGDDLIDGTIEDGFSAIINALQNDMEARDIVHPIANMLDDGVDELSAATLASIIIDALKHAEVSGDE